MRELEGMDQRPLRIVTEFGTVDADLRTNAGVSTLHYLNIVAGSNELLAIEAHGTHLSEHALERGPAGISLQNVYFVLERTEHRPTPGDPSAAARYQRQSIRLQLPGYLIEGYVHAPAGVDVISRVNNDRRAFMAVSTASVLGPEHQLAAPFVAVSRRHIQWIQPIDLLEEFDSDASGFADSREPQVAGS